DNKRISSPNGQVTNARVINYSSEATRRVDIFLTIDRGSDIEAAKAVLMEMITSHPLTLKDPEPTVHAEGHTELGTKLGCRIWVNRQDYWTVYYDIVEQLKDKLAAAGITMPTTTVIYHQSFPPTSGGSCHLNGGDSCGEAATLVAHAATGTYFCTDKSMQKLSKGVSPLTSPLDNRVGHDGLCPSNSPLHVQSSSPWRNEIATVAPMGASVAMGYVN
ncbi:MAG: mechanosensitive ion channel family protein, partial [Angelakisella sp.]